jgi:hypothetical protein
MKLSHLFFGLSMLASPLFASEALRLSDSSVFTESTPYLTRERVIKLLSWGLGSYNTAFVENDIRFFVKPEDYPKFLDTVYELSSGIGEAINRRVIVSCVSRVPQEC